MASKQVARSRKRPSASLTETLLQEQAIGTKLGENGDKMPNVLTESSVVRLRLVTEGVASGKTIARGEFGRCDVATQNGRIYSRKLMEREIARLMPDLKARRILGELDHPSDGKTSLKRVSHVLTNLSIDDNGVVEGECEILNTPEGKTLKALIEADVQVGVSSRGFGTTVPARGKVEGEDVQDDFVLKTYDFVADPAVKSAIPGIYTEDIDDDDLAKMFLCEFPEIAESIKGDGKEQASLEESKASDDKKFESRIREEMKEDFERNLRDALVKVKEQASSEIREELEKDPQVAGAKGVLAAIAEMVGAYRATPDEDAIRDALKSKDLEVAEAVKERDEAVKVGQAAAHALVIERKIAGHSMAKAIRKLLKGKGFESTDEAVEAVEAVMETLPKSEDIVTKEEAKVREENAELRGQVALLESKVEGLDSKLLKVASLNERIEAQYKKKLDESEDRVEAMREQVKELAKDAEDAISEMRSEVDRKSAILSEAELKAYKLEKVVGVANGRQLLTLLEGAQDKVTIDRLVEGHGTGSIGDPTLESMRLGLRKGSVSKGVSLEEGVLARSGVRDNDLGVIGSSMDEIRALAGFTNK